MDTPLGVADALGYLQHHLQELTEWQNASEHTINTTLAALTAQLQQITQLMTSSAPESTIALPPMPVSPPPVIPSSPALAASSKQWARPKLPSPPDFSGERSCKGTTLGLGLVTWVGSHLRAIVSPIAFPLSSLLLFCVILCEPYESNIGLCGNICQVPWERCLVYLVVYILVFCCRYTSVESHTSFWIYTLA